MFSKGNFEIIKRLDHAILNLSAKIKPDEAIMKQHRSYAQEVKEEDELNKNLFLI